MPIYEVEAIVTVTLQASDPDKAIEKVEEELGNHCSDVKVIGAK